MKKYKISRFLLGFDKQEKMQDKPPLRSDFLHKCGLTLLLLTFGVLITKERKENNNNEN